MKFTSVIVASCIGACSAAPFSFPLKNGFPNPSPDALTTIQKDAGGSLPNGALPKSVSAGVATALKLISTNELFEVAFFSDLLNNITSGAKGYQLNDGDKKQAVRALTAIIAQEELHSIGANAILKSVGEQPIAPCKYQFPTTDFKGAIALANTFTDLVLGALPAVQFAAGTQGGADGPTLIPLIGSILGQEAEQNGFYRTLLDKKPSAAPFLTGNAAPFALTALKNFLVPGSCPQAVNDLDKSIGVFPALNVVTPPTASSKKVTLSVSGTVDCAVNQVALVSGQVKPVVVPITNASTKDGVTTFDVAFSDPTLSDGLTIAAVVKQKMDFNNATDVAGATLFGPGLIEFN